MMPSSCVRGEARHQSNGGGVMVVWRWCGGDGDGKGNGSGGGLVAGVVNKWWCKSKRQSDIKYDTCHLPPHPR